MPGKLQSRLAEAWRSLVGARQLKRARVIERRLIGIDRELRSSMGYSHTTPISEVLTMVSSAVAILGAEGGHGVQMTRSEVGNALLAVVLEFLGPDRLLPLSQRIGEASALALTAEIKELSSVAVELIRK